MALSLPAFDFGRRVAPRAMFVNGAGVAADPTTVRWRIRPPSGAEILVAASGGAYTLDSPAVGTHRLLFTPPTPGRWVVRCEGLGVVEQATEGEFLVRSPRLTSASIAP